MEIREAEDELFEKWREKYKDSSFVIDGYPNPNAYLKEKRKVIFVLKDGNLGEPNLSEPYEDRVYDQRDELENFPTLWWTTIARWCFFLKNHSDPWSVAQSEIKTQDSIRSILSSHCIVQLKKTWGGGMVSNDKLSEVVINDKNEIISQTSIYEPDFIVACGNGDHLSKVFTRNEDKYKETSTGVRYWKLDLNDRSCYLVDYCHPSNRAGTKIKGVIAKGLASSIVEIERA